MQAPAQVTIKTNSEWFAENHQYMDRQERLKCYRNIRRIVETEITGIGDLLDIGNGGFFNYDTALVRHATAVDLFLKDGVGSTLNSSFRAGSILEMPFEADTFDCVLEQNVLHHITGPTVAQNFQNLQTGLAEMHRCLRNGGKAVIIESTVNRMFNLFEQAVYRPALWIKRGGHPVTFQFTPRQIIDAAKAVGFTVAEFSFIPRGLFLLQMGYLWPSILTPARPIKLILRK